MNKVIKKSIILENECCFSNLDVGEEAIFSYDVLSNSTRFSFVRKPIYHYTVSNYGQHTKGNTDPWWGVVHAIKQHLVKKDQYEKYSNVIVSLAFRALIICLYRESNNGTTFFKVRKKLFQTLKRYKREFDFRNVDKEYINISEKFLLIFLKANILLPIYLASKIRHSKRK